MLREIVDSILLQQNPIPDTATITSLDISQPGHDALRIAIKFQHNGMDFIFEGDRGDDGISYSIRRDA